MASIAIVGGGIAGLYCAWELLKREPKPSVTLYECLKRLGGRIETRDLQGFKAECGPMRFELEIEPLFSGLANELGIKFDPFPPPLSGAAKFPKYDLSPREFSASQKQAIKRSVRKGSSSKVISAMHSHHTSALDLLRFGIYRILNQAEEQPKLSLTEVVSGGTQSVISQYAGKLKETDYRRIRTRQTLDGVRLHTLGFWNALSRVLSPGAVAKIRDTGTFYHLMPENPSASEWAIFWLRLFRPDAGLSQIKSGVKTVVDRLEERLKNRGLVVELGSTVERISTGTPGKVSVKTATDAAAKEYDHVIVAVPAVPMRSLSEDFPPDIQTYVNAPIPFPLLKAFVVLAWPPLWTKLPEPHRGAHLVPTREIHYFQPEDGPRDKAMIMLYTDRPATAYWHPYTTIPHTEAQIGRTLDLKHELARQVAHLVPGGRVELVEKRIIDFAMRDWSEAPFGAASHAWPPNINVPEALDRLKAFRLEGANGQNNVHICGEAYSDYQGFIEGALSSARAVVATI